LRPVNAAIGIDWQTQRMDEVSQPDAAGRFARWRDIAWPREHGSWSLALEPLALGLLAAPSAAGAWLALGVLAGFFARRPLKIAVNDARPERRAAARGPLTACAVIGIGSLGAALAFGGMSWLGWLLPVVAAGAVFLFLDLRGEGREEMAEVIGTAAFAGVPAAMAALAGCGAWVSLALALMMACRSVTTVLRVRAYLRAEKTGGRRISPALLANALAVAAGAGCVRAGLAPGAVFILFTLFAGLALWLLVWPRPSLRARTLGLVEALLGLIFVAVTAFAWRMQG
jgi:hypothetical protein